MALKVTGQEQKAGIDASVGATPAQEPKVKYTEPQGFSSIGFGGRDVVMMNSNQGSEYTNGMAKNIVEAYSKLTASEKPRVNVMDKEVISGLAYSSIIVSRASDNGSVYYFIIMLGQTGREPMKASEIASEMQAMARIPNQNQVVNNIFTPDEAIDSVLHKEAVRVLTSEWGNKEFLSVDSMVVGTHDEAANIALRVASTAYNAIKIEITLSEGNYGDLNIREALSGLRNASMKLDTVISKKTVLNAVDKPLRQDFQVDLNLINNSNQNLSMNTQDARDTLCRISGFIESIPAEEAAPIIYGKPMGTNIRLHPNIVITSNAVSKPTTGYMLMGLVAGMVMANNNMWLAALMPTTAKDPHNVGALNIMTNLENNQNKVGGSLAGDLTSKKYTAEQSYNLIKQMYSLDPIVSYDIEASGPETFYTTMLGIAASPSNTTSKINAAKEIIDAAVQLTDGGFPADFNINEIFVNSGVIVPLGTWADKTGERDIRDIDLAFIANQTGDVSLLNNWVKATIGEKASGVNSFAAKAEIIASLIPDAIINGQAVRVTFTSKFISTLVSAAIGAGLTANYEPKVLFEEQYNLGMVGDIMNGAGIQAGAGSFGSQHINAGPQFNMDSTFNNMGYNRY